MNSADDDSDRESDDEGGDNRRLRQHIHESINRSGDLDRPGALVFVLGANEKTDLETSHAVESIVRELRDDPGFNAYARSDIRDLMDSPASILDIALVSNVLVVVVTEKGIARGYDQPLNAIIDDLDDQRSDRLYVYTDDSVADGDLKKLGVELDFAAVPTDDLALSADDLHDLALDIESILVAELDGELPHPPGSERALRHDWAFDESGES